LNDGRVHVTMYAQVIFVGIRTFTEAHLTQQWQLPHAVAEANGRSFYCRVVPLADWMRLPVLALLCEMRRPTRRCGKKMGIN